MFLSFLIFIALFVFSCFFMLVDGKDIFMTEKNVYPVSPLMRRQLSLQAEGYKMVTIFSLNGCLPQAFTGYSSSL